MNEKIKRQTFNKIAGLTTWEYISKARIKIGNYTIHYRCCSIDKKNPTKFKFNINPNTITANYELWICGDSDTYYLIPINIIKEIYNDPDAYKDYHHEDIIVISVDTKNNSVIYAIGGKIIDLKQYFMITLE